MAAKGGYMRVRVCMAAKVGLQACEGLHGSKGGNSGLLTCVKTPTLTVWIRGTYLLVRRKKIFTMNV